MSSLNFVPFFVLFLFFSIFIFFTSCLRSFSLDFVLVLFHKLDKTAIKD